MGAESSTSMNSDGNNKNIETQVVLNVYDLTPINNYMVWFGFGIFHSGIEVHGKEYGFGAHDFPASGVFEVEPRSCPASEYHGDTYHLISKNCNHFTDDISWRLTGKHIPGWVNRLARLGALCSCLLPESLQVTTVKQMPEYHDCSEEECTESVSTTTARESTEIDDDQEKSLLSPLAVSGDVTFVKEAHS
ncbi:deSI-like protein At4g17486 isoform X4 [Quercus robur]|uniref:deSI-like protein At4g17486 isoform X4 n=1 Tax=Quercus lobata TaxID=97700 RepID=UPI001244889E|nr:deSI-like protein At4g17486 isoform X4 [Quercus lobata]XP_050271856.1 deSI-like protein At4g17486 isoform X4 [Quercus robur]